MDAGFLKRVYRLSVAVWLFALLICWALGSLATAAGVTIGFGVSLGSLIVLERATRALFVTEGTKRRKLRRLLGVALAKYAMIALILWAAFRSGWVNPVGLAIGIGIPQGVMFLKALGTALTFGPEPRGRL